MERTSQFRSITPRLEILYHTRLLRSNEGFLEGILRGLTPFFRLRRCDNPDNIRCTVTFSLDPSELSTNAHRMPDPVFSLVPFLLPGQFTAHGDFPLYPI